MILCNNGHRTEKDLHDIKLAPGTQKGEATVKGRGKGGDEGKGKGGGKGGDKGQGKGIVCVGGGGDGDGGG
jgi:hypothetical protein